MRPVSGGKRRKCSAALSVVSPDLACAHVPLPTTTRPLRPLPGWTRSQGGHKGGTTDGGVPRGVDVRRLCGEEEPPCSVCRRPHETFSFPFRPIASQIGMCGLMSVARLGRLAFLVFPPAFMAAFISRPPEREVEATGHAVVHILLPGATRDVVVRFTSTTTPPPVRPPTTTIPLSLCLILV